MKVRMLAVISIFALAAWLPIRAQQAGTPAAPAPQTQTPSAPGDSAKPAAKHDCCCAAKTQAGQDGAATHDHKAMDCCHDKGGETAKGNCCAGKDAKEMACCGKNDKDSKVAMDCCKGMKEGQCSAKEGKDCCKDMQAKDGKGCCAGMAKECAAHATGK